SYSQFGITRFQVSNADPRRDVRHPPHSKSWQFPRQKNGNRVSPRFACTLLQAHCIVAPLREISQPCFSSERESKAGKRSESAASACPAQSAPCESHSQARPRLAPQPMRRCKDGKTENHSFQASE